MIRDAAYHEAKWRVKIGHAFCELGYDIKGVVHVGANDGYEVQYYLAMGVEKVLCFEPLRSAIDAFRLQYNTNSCVRLIPHALGNVDGEVQLYIAPGDGKGSSTLPELPTVAYPSTTISILRFSTFLNLWRDVNLADYDCLVIDTQGT